MSSSLPDVLKTALEKIQHIAKTETVFGEPIIAGDVTIIPISKVSIGFAAGGANSEKRSGAGTGAGGGVQITPVAFVTITGEKVQIHPLEKSDPGFSKLIGLAPDLIKKVSKIMDKNKKKEKKSDKKDKNSSD